MSYYTIDTVENYGGEDFLKRVLKDARGPDGNNKLFITFDVDVLDPAFVPGTGTPVPGGLTMREALPIVRGLCSESNMIGFEIVELDPLLDSTYRSALNTNYIIHACLTGIAMRRSGITDGAYLSELTTEHMQPEAGIKAAKEGKKEEVDPNHAKPKNRN